jgi:uncharacterized lipoprotein YajG
MRLLIAAAALLLVAGCGTDTTDSATDGGGATKPEMPSDIQSAFVFLVGV